LDVERHTYRICTYFCQPYFSIFIHLSLFYLCKYPRFVYLFGSTITSFVNNNQCQKGSCHCERKNKFMYFRVVRWYFRVDRSRNI
jgi:hypothetical protein